MNEEKFVLSTMGHTWILDMDGTIVKHNGYKLDGEDSFLPGVAEFLRSIPEKDMIVFITSQTDEYREMTVKWLRDHGVRYDPIIFNAPYGERILVNDDKPSGLCMTIVARLKRDQGINFNIAEDSSL